MFASTGLLQEIPAHQKAHSPPLVEESIVAAI